MKQVARYARVGQAARLGLVSPDEPGVVLDAGPSPPEGFTPSPEAWESLCPTGKRVAIEDVELLPPVIPRKIIGVGLNYRDHAAEGGVAVPDRPYVFAKFSTALIGHGHPIVVPHHESQPDWEAELAVVMGVRLKHAQTDAEALDCVGGYTAVNDVSGRQAQVGDIQVVRGKSFDTFAPLGPTIHSASGVEWDNLKVECRLSGEVVQSGTTGDMVFGVTALLRYLSHQFTLEPGDMIMTGTPAGTGIGRNPQRWLQHGDVVQTIVGDLDPLENRVIRR